MFVCLCETGCPSSCNVNILSWLNVGNLAYLTNWRWVTYKAAAVRAASGRLDGHNDKQRTTTIVKPSHSNMCRLLLVEIIIRVGPSFIFAVRYRIRYPVVCRVVCTTSCLAWSWRRWIRCRWSRVITNHLYWYSSLFVHSTEIR